MKTSPRALRGLGLGLISLGVLLLGSLLAAPVSLADGPYYVYLPFLARGCSPATVPISGYWRDYLNYYRATACLPPVAEDSTWSTGDYKHAIYIVKNDILQHDEDVNNPWYTPEGHTAAQQSNLAASYDVNASDYWALDTWMQAPFHAVGMLDPTLVQVGYGSYREANGNLQMGAALNVIAGLDSLVDTTYPIYWPGNGMTVPVRLHWGETPSPLTSCPGYTAPSGLPIILQVAPTGSHPVVSATSFTQNGQSLPHCVFSETTYTNPDSTAQNTARSILAARHAIVLIPRQPLLPGQTYTASITVDGKVHTWSFSISNTASTATGLESPGLIR